jgi:hypothetical protein
MDDSWNLNPLGGNAPLNSLGLYDGRGRLRFYSTGHQWFFDVATGKPAFYADGQNLYWADGKPILLNIDRSLLDASKQKEVSSPFYLLAKHLYSRGQQ